MTPEEFKDDLNDFLDKVQSGKVQKELDVYKVIAHIKDMHTASKGRYCPECEQTFPCNTYEYVDGLLASRFDD